MGDHADAPFAIKILSLSGEELTELMAVRTDHVSNLLQQLAEHSATFRTSKLTLVLGEKLLSANTALADVDFGGSPTLHVIQEGRQIPARRYRDQEDWLGSISEADPSSFDGSGFFESCVPHPGMSVWIDLGSDDLTCLHWTRYFASFFQTSPQ